MLKNHRILVVIFYLITSSCCKKENEGILLPTKEVYIEILKKTNVYENNELNIHIVNEEYLNDSSLIVSLNQHSLAPKDITKVETKFLFKEMKVYTYTEPLDYWVPDSFFKQFLIRSRGGKVTFDELKQLFTISTDSSNQLFDSTYVIKPKDFL